MADGPTLWSVLDAFAQRAERRMTPYSTKTEIADELGAPRSDTDSLVDEAVEKRYVDEDPRYDGYWRLNEDGQSLLDAAVFNP